MPDVSLKIVPPPAPGTAAVLVGNKTGVLMEGPGKTRLLCGTCGNILVDGVSQEDFNKKFVTDANNAMLIQCGKCESFNSAR